MGHSITAPLVSLVLFLFSSLTFAQESKFSKADKVGNQWKTSYAVGSISTWGESHFINRKLDHRKYEVLSTLFASGLSYRYESKSQHTGISLEIGVLGGQANSQSTAPDLTYFYRGASLTGASLTLGYAFIPASQDVSIGLALPFLVRRIEFSVPQSGYAFEKIENISAYLALEMTWALTPNLTLIQRFSKPYKGDESMWTAALGLRI